MKTAHRENLIKERTGFLSLPADAWKYTGIFIAILLLFTFTFDFFEKIYLLAFLKPVSLLGYYSLKLFGLPVTFSSEHLPLGYCDYILPHQILRVNFGCTGLYVLFIFLAAVLAFPISFRSKMLGLLLGIPVFTLYSILRLIIMGIVGNWIPQYLDIIHNYLMIVINIAFTIWLYGVWLNYALQKDQS